MTHPGASLLARPVNRRRALAILGISVGVIAAAGARVRAVPQRLRWDGEALGAVARMDLYHESAGEGRRLIAACLEEVRRLEAIFSLTRPDSALSRLNREGVLTAPPPELVTVLRHAVDLFRVSGGAFDVTVQPLWTLYADHFRAHPDDETGPTAEAITAARARVGSDGLQIDEDRIRFLRPAMGVTLNGIAGGYITDCVIALLRRHGVERVFADLGEIRALGRHPDGQPWLVGLADPAKPETFLDQLPLQDQAMGSSGGYGTVFDKAGQFHHIFDPASGRSAAVWAGTTVQADDATRADALSTALAVAPRSAAERILRQGGGNQAWFIDQQGQIHHIAV